MQRFLFSPFTTVILIALVLILPFKIAQATYPMPSSAIPNPLPLQITCQVAVREKIAELCVTTRPGAIVQISVNYCAGGSASSGELAAGKSGEVRWIWFVDSRCKGYAIGIVKLSWRGLQALSMLNLYVW